MLYISFKCHNISNFRLVSLISHCLLFNVLCFNFLKLLYYTKVVCICQQFFKFIFELFVQILSIQFICNLCVLNKLLSLSTCSILTP